MTPLRNRPAARDSRRRGFTLVEVLVAMLLTGLVMSSVMGVLHDAMNSRDMIHNISQFQRSGPMILDIIEADLRAMAPYNVAGRRCFFGKKGSLRGADADSLDFVVMRSSSVETQFSDAALREERSLQPPFCEVGYHLKPNRREPVFMELWRREDPMLDDDPYRGGSYTKLYDKVTNFKITYFAEPGSSAKSEDRWSCEEQEFLPQRVQVDLELEIEPRVQVSDRPLDAKLRRSFRRIFNLDPDFNRILLANLRPRLPEPPAADAGSNDPGMKGNVPGGQLSGPGGGAGAGPGSNLTGFNKNGDKNIFDGKNSGAKGFSGGGGAFPGGGGAGSGLSVPKKN
jgi:prepilin-type N-terminal cleavage/methylation domain-containing protein